MSNENGLPDLSFGFIKNPPPRVPPTHEITEGKILCLSLDLWPGPFGTKAEPVQPEELED